jgi:hypothetical protein
MDRPTIQNEDEKRLLMFFRCLTPDQQDQFLLQAGEAAKRRCLPEESVWSLAPCVAGISPGPIRRSVWDPDIDGTITEVIRDAIHGTGEPIETLLRSSVFDESTIIPHFVHRANATMFKQGGGFNCDERFAQEYIKQWRYVIAAECYRVGSKMARTVPEAEAQRIPVPDSIEEWVSFALTLDGDRIAAEIEDWDEPGEDDVDLKGTIEEYRNPTIDEYETSPPISHVLIVRLLLYSKLRFLQRNRKRLDEPKNLVGVDTVLQWLREQWHQDQ